MGGTLYRWAGRRHALDRAQPGVDNAAVDVIALERLGKRYGARVGVEDLSLTVPAGAMYGFLGPNGAGKTTTMRILLGLLKPSAGCAFIGGRDCWRDSPTIKQEVGYLPGDLRLAPWMTCREALRIFGLVRRRDLLANGLELAREFELDPSLRVGAMSRGTRQKLGLVLAMAHDPQLLILDEPTASLDPLVQKRLYARLRSAVADGRTVLLSSHTLTEVEDLCSHVAILRQGRLAACDSIEALRGRARRRVTVYWQRDAAVTQADAGVVEWQVREGRAWRGTLVGSAEEFLRWLQGKPIEDFSLESASLTDVFEAFYS